MREVQLPSGAVLKVNPAPFGEAKALMQALFAEARGVEIIQGAEIPNMMKDLLFSGLSSVAIDKALKPCLARCIYSSGKGELKVDEDTFEPAEAREDYMDVVFEVVKENVGPFGKGLYAKFGLLMSMIEKSRS